VAIADVLADGGKVFLFDETVIVFLAAAGEGDGCADVREALKVQEWALLRGERSPRAKVRIQPMVNPIGTPSFECPHNNVGSNFNVRHARFSVIFFMRQRAGLKIYKISPYWCSVLNKWSSAVPI
jgi:hypothetical protein